MRIIDAFTHLFRRPRVRDRLRELEQREARTQALVESLRHRAGVLEKRVDDLACRVPRDEILRARADKLTAFNQDLQYALQQLDQHNLSREEGADS